MDQQGERHLSGDNVSVTLAVSAYESITDIIPPKSASFTWTGKIV